MNLGFLQVCVLNCVPVCMPRSMMNGVGYYPLVLQGTLGGTLTWNSLLFPRSQNLQERSYLSDLVSHKVKLG